MKNRKEFSKIAVICLSYIIMLGQAPAMEEQTDYIYKTGPAKEKVETCEPSEGDMVRVGDLFLELRREKERAPTKDEMINYVETKINIPASMTEIILDQLGLLGFCSEPDIIQKSMQQEESNKGSISSYQGPLAIGLCIGGVITFFIYYKFINND